MEHPTAGSCFIGSQITLGANKWPGDPVQWAQIMLLDAANSDQQVENACSDAMGIFSFSNIPIGVYNIYAEVPGKFIIPAFITIDAINPSYNGV